MAQPTCPKCDSRRFEVQVFEPLRSTFRLLCINCAQCGAVVSVMDFYNMGQMVRDLGKKLGVGDVG